MANPFSFYRSTPLYHNFVGRTALAEAIADRAKQGDMTFVVGLPRMGKTSLMYHVFLEDEPSRQWQEQYHKIPILLQLNSIPDGKTFWRAMALRIRRKLGAWRKSHPDTGEDAMADIMDLLAGNGDEEMFDNVYESINATRQRLGLTFIFVIDELDYLWKYKYSECDFQRLRNISSLAHIVTCSRRPPRLIEQKAYGSSYLQGKGTVIFVGCFSDDDVKRYWQHFSSAFDGLLDKHELKDYKALVARYAGSHPMLMSMMNSYAFSSGDLARWRTQLNSDDRRQAELQFRRALVDEFREQMRYVEEQELKEIAIQAVLGGFGQIDETAYDDGVALLKDYQFIRQVDAREKQDIFALPEESLALEGQVHYVCLSEFFSHYMRATCRPLMRGTDLLFSTEMKLRQLVRQGIRSEYGDNAFDVVAGNEQSDDYSEKWLSDYKKKMERTLTEEDFAKLEESLQGMARLRQKTALYDCKDPATRPPIDLLSATTLGQLWHLFIKQRWKEFYAPVLDPQGKDRSHRRWYSNFNHVLQLRNATFHLYRSVLTDEAIGKAEEKCRQISECIDRWTLQQTQDTQPSY